MRSMKIISSLITAVLILKGISAMAADDDKVAVIETKFGKIVIEFYDKDAPKTTANFIKLANDGFYSGTTFHRVIPNFMIQGGDPISKKDPKSGGVGTGGPGYTVPAEIKRDNSRGAVATARQGDDFNPKRESSGSQFFINVKDNGFLNGGYTVFGNVIAGMDVADKIVNVPRDGRDNPNDPVVMTKVTIMTRAEALKK
jgi:cyclophilin family peptidyl-prolyl cis-trans isomerase